MFVYEQRETLLNTENLYQITIEGSMVESRVDHLPDYIGQLKVLDGYRAGDTGDDKMCDCVLLLEANGSIYEEDLESIEVLFDQVYAYYQLELPQDLALATFNQQESLIKIDMDQLMDLLKRAGANRERIASAAGVDRVTIDSWIAGDTAMDLSELKKIENAYPLLPWDLIVSKFTAAGLE